MAQLDPGVVTAFVGPLAGITGVIVFTALIIRYKLKAKELEARGRDAELGPVVDALRDDLADMQEHTHAQLAEIQERLDFTERMLVAGRESPDEKSK